MIEVSMQLHNASELNLFSDFVDRINAQRQAPPVVNGATMDALLAHANSHPGSLASGLPSADAPPKINDGLLEAAITSYYKRHGIAAAKSFLAEYGVKRVTLLPEDKQAEAYVRLLMT